MSSIRCAYLSFDVVPAPKGAATHIQAFATAIATQFASVDLVTVAPGTDTGQRVTHPNLTHTVLDASGPTLIHRVLRFREQLRQWLSSRFFHIIHIRSIYEGLPIALNPRRYCDRLVFEVNGLPSIELKYRYPGMAGDHELLTKLRQQEQYCLAAADAIVVPSQVTAAYLRDRGVPSDRLHYIPNGVDLSCFAAPRLALPVADRRSPVWSVTPARPLRLLYFGVLASWQGVDLAVRAVAMVQERVPATLEWVGQAQNIQRRALHDLVRKLGIADRFLETGGQSPQNLADRIGQADLVLAPLTLCDRNVVQGCCPLKILEAMAVGTPVIASDLPVVRELGQPGGHWWAVRPNSVADLAAAIAYLAQHPDTAQALAIAARSHVCQHHDWHRAGAALVRLYQKYGEGKPRTSGQGCTLRSTIP